MFNLLVDFFFFFFLNFWKGCLKLWNVRMLIYIFINLK